MRMKRERICPECKTRELDRYQHLCSECAYYNRMHTFDLAKHKQMSDPVKRKKHIEAVTRWKKANYKTRAEWREIAVG